jgi:hypothetical protein
MEPAAPPRPATFAGRIQDLSAIATVSADCGVLGNTTPAGNRHVPTTSLHSMGSTKMTGMDAEWTPADVRKWAQDRGIAVGDRGRLPGYVTELYLAQPPVIREWARRQGISIKTRGRIPTDVFERYLARPAAVREWARRRGMDIGERGRLPADLVELYLAQFRDLYGDVA